MVICQVFASRKLPYKLLFIYFKILHIFLYIHIHTWAHTHIYVLGDIGGLFGFMLFHRPGYVMSSNSFSPEVHFGAIILVALQTNAEGDCDRRLQRKTADRRLQRKMGDRKNN